MAGSRILFCGDPHSKFQHIIDAAEGGDFDAVVLLGDLEPQRPLHVELAPLVDRGVQLLWIGGNHDADSDQLWHHTWGSDLLDRHISGRVVELRGGATIGGLGGVFREAVWHPSAPARGGRPAFHSRAEHARSTPRQDRWLGTGPHRRHWASIYPDEFDLLASLKADILVTHEAGGSHPHGVALIDDLARAMNAKVTVHGHQHDCLDSSERWSRQGFRSFGVGLRGLSVLDTCTWEMSTLLPGELDHLRATFRKPLL